MSQSKQTVAIPLPKNTRVEKKDDEKQEERLPVGLNSNWVDQVYSLDLISDEELTIYYEAFRYHGFDRTNIMIKLNEKAQDPKVAVQLIILCALQGPVRASKTKLLNGKTPTEMGISSSGQKNTENISCARITSSTADLAAHYLKRMNFPKRIFDDPCPAFLQFPAAGSIKLPERLRQLHIDFAKRFSKLINGVFNDSIYGQMMQNAYLDEKLKLFT
jgi:hypothetical protein